MTAGTVGRTERGLTAGLDGKEKVTGDYDIKYDGAWHFVIQCHAPCYKHKKTNQAVISVPAFPLTASATLLREVINTLPVRT